MKKDSPNGDGSRQAVARVNNAYLYKDELTGLVATTISKEDSAARVEAYINSWIRKQLLIKEASKKININEAELERKILDYRYSLIAYEYQSHYIKEHLDTIVQPREIEDYYKANIDNFILKQNIVRATFIKVPKDAPQVDKVKDLILSRSERDLEKLKSYCLSFSVAYHLADSSWMIFDELVRDSPLEDIPNKVQFLKANPYHEEQDERFRYFLKVNEYRISDNVSPLEFVRDEITSIILNKRKVDLAKKLEDKVYNDALEKEEFEIIQE
ncbi:MAG TPA: peptidyl-prolyl cis-trans isomerase [Chryseosolibacter sp.]|nr:peptidyl-prolyl cis-trans isomerase [Chryseosolibacter sp.]